MQNLMQIHSSTHSIILNVMAKQYRCSLNVIYCLPPLSSAVKLSLFTHAHSSPHSPWLPGYINVLQAILITLTIVGLFLIDLIHGDGRFDFGW